MRDIFFRILAVAVFFLVAADACCPADIKTNDKEYYRIAANDILDIQVYQEADLSGDFEIKEDGAITYPLLGSVMVKGLTKQEAEARITELLARDYLVNPFVHISVKTYHDRSIMVLGCVQKPGSYPFPQDNTITLLQAISLAGGFTGYASINGTKIVRSAPDGKKITVDPRVNDIVSGKRKDTDLQPDDLVFVPERIF